MEVVESATSPAEGDPLKHGRRTHGRNLGRAGSGPGEVREEAHAGRAFVREMARRARNTARGACDRGSNVHK
jgi:hypothetical protein